jgi:hypothetical protein
MPLTLAPGWAAENEDERDGDVPGPELFRRFIDILGRAGRPPPEE